MSEIREDILAFLVYLCPLRKSQDFFSHYFRVQEMKQWIQVSGSQILNSGYEINISSLTVEPIAQRRTVVGFLQWRCLTGDLLLLL